MTRPERGCPWTASPSTLLSFSMGMSSQYNWSRVVLRGAIVGALFSLSCSGKVYVIDDDETDPDGTGGGPSPIGGTGGGPMVGSGGFQDGTGGDIPWEDPECPDEPPPDSMPECDPLDPIATCGVGEGCYPYLDYPFGEQCGHAVFGAICVPASTGDQGDFCGDNGSYCSPGYMCVVGAAGGKRCGKICEPVKDHDCPEGLICGATDIQGLGVCF